MGSLFRIACRNGPWPAPGRLRPTLRCVVLLRTPFVLAGMQQGDIIKAMLCACQALVCARQALVVQKHELTGYVLNRVDHKLRQQHVS